MKRKTSTYFYGSQPMKFVGMDNTVEMELAINELINYVDSSLYTENLDQLQLIIDWGVIDIEKSESQDRIDYFLNQYKTMIDTIQTDTEIETAVLDEVKRKAVIELSSYDSNSYNETEKVLVDGYINEGLLAIENATDAITIAIVVEEQTALIRPIQQKEYKDKKMYLNTSTYDIQEILNGADPDLYPGESDFRLIQVYYNHFPGLKTNIGTSKPQPSYKLFTMSKEEVE